MIITSSQIREKIKKYFDKNKSFFSEKLYKTRAIKDKRFYAPKFEDLKIDYIESKIAIADSFDISLKDIRELASNPYTIYDCDNMARRLRVALQDYHYERYRLKQHNIPYEYAVFQITAEIKDMLNDNIIHDFVMVFIEDSGGIGFADLMRDKVWSIKEEIPNIINIGG